MELRCVEEVFIEIVNDSMNVSNLFSISVSLYTWLFYRAFNFDHSQSACFTIHKVMLSLLLQLYHLNYRLSWLLSNRFIYRAFAAMPIIRTNVFFSNRLETIYLTLFISHIL
jgi:hypothetical protein